MSVPTVAQVSEWLREARDEEEKTRRQVSVLLDVTEKTVERWEDPERPNLPDAHQFLTLVVYYKASMLDLLALPSTKGSRARGRGADAGDEEEGPGRKRKPA